MSEFAKPSPASDNFIAPGTVVGSAMPSTVVSDLFTFSALGSLVPRSKESGFLSSVMCLRPIDVSPASYTPGVSFARGSFASEPVIPAGKGGAGCGANGFSGCAGVGDGDGDGVCANKFAANKKTDATAMSKRLVRMWFIVSPLEGV